MRPLPATFLRGVVAPDGLPDTTVPEICVSGRSNVGKSSLLNVLFGIRGLARVSRTPGRTREINFFSIGGRYHLVDLPGYGYARAPATSKGRWGELVRGYLDEREQLAGILQLVDARHEPSEQDFAMLEWLAEAGRAAIVVATKIDKLSRMERAKRLQALATHAGELRVSPFSAVTREGREELLSWIEGAVSGWKRPPRAGE
ncbi:MAG: ribosome biogenesis GTP-binding protein YihA/YsxC [bacterium]